MIASILQYYRSCYQADLRAIHLINFLAPKVSFARLETDPAWASRTWHKHPVPTSWGTDLHKHLLIYGKEQQLYAGAFMLVGRAKVLGKAQEVCSPLYLIPGDLTREDDVFMVELDYAGMVVNPAFADVLQQGETLGEHLYQQLQHRLPTNSLGFDTLQAIEKTFGDLGLPVSLDGLYDFPLALGLSELKTRVQAQRDGFHLLPVLGLGVMDKQTGSLGVLNELGAMASAEEFSPVIRALFSAGKVKRKKRGFSPILLPVTLSVNQEAILRASATETISLVNGPPGTGKSFTIAAIAADRLSKGESVLIAAKNMQAVEVIADKLERDFQLPGVPIRATQKEYRKYLRKRLKNWLYGMGLNRVHQKELDLQKSSIERLHLKIHRLTNKAMDQGENEQRYGRISKQTNVTWRQTIQHWMLRAKIKRGPPFWELMDDIETLIQDSHAEGSNYLTTLFNQRLQHALKRYRADLQWLWEALRSRSGNEKEAYMQGVNFSKVLHALPIWLVNSANVHQVLPLEVGLFDLLIIDEASQSDIASALPLLQRAKRAVIVGDPNQLRHVSFLSHDQQNRFARQFGLADYKPKAHLSFRDTSLLDLVADRLASQDQVQMLDEHFRSLPGIIAFSNERFYDSRLKIMTATPQNIAEMSVFIHKIEGKRQASGQNRAEADAIVLKVKSLVAAEAALEVPLCQSIGLLSPFRGQVDLLKRIFEEQFSVEVLQRHRILIGSPYDFQGEERDVMFLSWTIDPASVAGIYLYLNREDVFNVSITRARVAQHLYTSLPASQMPVKNLLRDYLESCEAKSGAVTPSEHLMDDFMQEVLRFLEDRGFHHYLVNYPIAGMEIDLVVMHQGKTFCIDFIGYPGPYQKPLPLARWKMLGRVGLPGFALPYSQWLLKRQLCEDALLRFLSVGV